MTLEDCPNCPGNGCPTYRAQADRVTLGVRVNIEAGLSVTTEQLHRMLHESLTPSGRVLDSDHFTVHTTPGDNGSTDYVALLADRILEPAAC